MPGLVDFDIKYLKGVGEARATLLKKELGISNLRDLLYYFPYKHADRSRFYKISEFKGDMAYVQVKGSFIGFATEGEGAKKRLKALFTDGERKMEVVWFSKIRELASAYRIGETYTLFGKPSLWHDTWSMAHPEIDAWSEESAPKGLTGIYTLTENMRKRGFTNRIFRKIMESALQLPQTKHHAEILSPDIITRHNLMSWHEAMLNIHFPASPEALQRARYRLKFEELYFIELHILRYSKTKMLKSKGIMMPRVGARFMKFYNEVLPFKLTSAQQRVVKEIHHDINSGMQMNRLLQGDVGSGKTLVAFLSMLLAVDNGTQACLMAPTEILATQHYEGLKKWCDASGVTISLLKGSTGKKQRRIIHQSLADGSLNILVGTHALIEDPVKFNNLGLAIIDEQHRFGVAQRARLWNKNATAPHMLVMTATPIPRTLAMTVYGDLEVSVIDELPPGRKPITTILRYEEGRMEVWQSIWSELQKGRQAYIVYPLIKENEKIDLKSLEEGYRVVNEVFGPKFRIAYVHGQMKPDEKEHQMNLFVSGEAQILVATTVIEVGVNVPNATVMMINDAHRFGLAQLHQLRGRVGRGGERSYCVLMSKANIGTDTRKRLELMTKTTDGFVIAEEDMKMRGPGDIDGTLQSGLAFDLHIANLATDGPIVTVARHHALHTLSLYPVLTGASEASATVPKIVNSIIEELKIRFAGDINWSKIS